MGICTVRSVIDIFRWTFLGSGSIPIRVNQLERTYTYSCLWFKRSLDGAFVALLSKRPSRYWPFFVINIISAADRSMRYVGDLEIRLGFTRIAVRGSIVISQIDLLPANLNISTVIIVWGPTYKIPALQITFLWLQFCFLRKNTCLSIIFHRCG